MDYVRVASPYIPFHLAQEIEDDRHALPNLARALSQGAADQRWDTAVVDALAGCLVMDYLSAALPNLAPRTLFIANTRRLAESLRHRESVAKFLAEAGIAGDRTLIITDHVDTGDSALRLSHDLRNAGAASVDLATLGSYKMRDWEGWRGIADDVFISMYQRPNVYSSDLLRAGIGRKCIEGHPEPQVDPDASLAQVHVVSDLMKTLANNFIKEQSAPSI